MYKIFYVIYLITFILFSGCGGGGSSSGSSSSSTSSGSSSSSNSLQTIIGQFFDSAVQGITYTCSNTATTGVTDSNGTFEYDKDCGTLTLTIGGVILGSTSNIPFDQQLYIADLVGVDRNDTNNTEVLNMARFLQSLDDNNNTFDGIVISQTIINNFSDDTLDFRKTPAPDILEINTTITSNSLTLISENDAQAHLTYTLNSNLDLNLSSPPPAMPILTTTPSMTNEDNTTVEVNGQPKTSIYVNSIDTNIDIPVTSKITIGLDTSSGDGTMDFNITLEDSTLQQSNPLSFSIIKDTVSPSITTSSTISIAEGNTTAMDIDATDINTLTYSLTGTDANAFDINSTNGIVTFKVAPTDYEYPTDQNKDNIYNITANVTDGINNTTQNIIITVTNVADTAPTLTALTTSILESASNNTIVGNIAMNPGDTNVTSFVLKETDNTTISTMFKVDTNGTITLLDNTNLDYETTTQYILRATATNGFGDSNIVDIVINVTNIADTPPTINNFSATIDENIAVGTIIGDINITDPGDSTISAFTMYESDGTTLNNTFTISNSGTISVKSGATIDYETKSSYDLKAVATNSAGDSNSSTVSITVNDLPDVVATIENFTTSTDENISNNTLLGNITITDIGDSNITSFTINGAGATIFDINSSGSLKVSDNSNLDYETTNEYNLTVYATNNAGDSLDKNITITINDIPDVVPIIENFTTSIDENVSIGFHVGNIIVTSPGDTDITDFNLSVTTNFDINASGYIVTNSTLDYETTNEYNLTVYATNNAGDSLDKNITITINDIPDVVPIIENFTTSIDENVSIGFHVGNIIVTSPGDTNITNFTLSDTTNFDINTSGYIITNSTFDYETTTEYNFTIYATNTYGNSDEMNITISINDIPDVVPIIENFTGSIDENVTTGTNVGNITITTAGDTNISAITLSGTDSTYFDVDTNGTITTSATSSFNYETKTLYNLTAIATNMAGDSASVTVDININNFIEPQPTLQATEITFNEDELADTIIGQVTILEEGQSNIDNFTLSGEGINNFRIDPYGVIRLNNSVAYNSSSYIYNLTATAINSNGSSNTVNVVITVLELSNLYIYSAVYDNNNSSTVNDDRLLIYFSKNIDTATLAADPSVDFNVTVAGTIGSGSITSYNASNYNLYKINGDSSTGSTEMIGGNTKIQIAQGEITDTNGTLPTTYSIETVESYNHIVKTGQAHSYDENGTIDGSIKDDYFYSNTNVDSNFTRDNVNNIVFDNVKNLIWQDDTNGSLLDWETAKTYCSDLIINTYSNWRVPTKKELWNIFDRNNYNPAFNNIFVNKGKVAYWTDTPSAEDTNNTWFYYGAYGTTDTIIQTNSTSLSVKCVHDK